MSSQTFRDEADDVLLSTFSHHIQGNQSNELRQLMAANFCLTDMDIGDQYAYIRMAFKAKAYNAFLVLIDFGFDIIQYQSHSAETFLHELVNHDYQTKPRFSGGSYSTNQYNDPEMMASSLLFMRRALALVDVNARDEMGAPALHIACGKRFYDQIKILLEFKADPNIVNNDGLTALHYLLTFYGKPIDDNLMQCVKILLEYGADEKAKDSRLGLTPAQMVLAGISARLGIVLR